MEISKIETIVFDLGGIFVPEKWRYIKSDIANFLKITSSSFQKIMNQFQTEIRKGNISLHEFYSKLIKINNLKNISPDEILDHHLKVYELISTEQDPKLIELVKKLKIKKYNLACATNTEIEIANYNRKRPNSIFSHFDKTFISTEIREDKYKPEFYKKMHRNLKKPIIFIDNDPAYIWAAQKGGITNCILYGQYKKGFSKLLKNLKKFGITI